MLIYDLLLLLLLLLLLTAGPHTSQGESFYPGLVEEQAEAHRDGSLIA